MTWHANRGVARNKKPLSNILYDFSEKGPDGSYAYRWAYEQHFTGTWNFSGTITEDRIKAILSPNQWQKFRSGRATQFVVQRRVDGRNIPID